MMLAARSLRSLMAMAVLVVLAGCGGTGAPSVSGGATGPVSDLVEGVPGPCEMLEDVDESLYRRVAQRIDPEVSHGPVMLVEDHGVTVVGTTTYTSPGVEGDSAVWSVHDDGTIEAINREATRNSDFSSAPVDSAGEGPLARAMAQAQDCSLFAADKTTPDPPAPPATMAPELMTAGPDPARPGDEVTLRFPEQTARGIAFHLQRSTDDGGWEITHFMASDANGDQYAQTVPADTNGWGTIDVGIGGLGPDHVTLPDDLEPGSYRICTANAGDDFCTPLEVVSASQRVSPSSPLSTNDASEPPISTENSPVEPVTLYVSNQSFDDPSVDVTISIDGTVVVQRQFEVEGQHTWIEFNLALPVGEHKLVASSDSGLQNTFTFTTQQGEPRWLVVDYWWFNEERPEASQENQFTFQASDEPVGFD